MSGLRTGLVDQNDPDTVMRRAAAAAQPSNGNVVALPQTAVPQVSSATQPVYNQATGKFEQRQRPQAPSTSGTSDAAPIDTSQDQGLAAVTNQIFGLESDFGRNPATTPSKVGPAVGPMQLTPDTWRQYAQPGEDINNAADNKRVGDRVVADLWNKSGGNKTAVLIGYNAGEGAMRHYLQTGQIPTNLEGPYRNAVGVDGKTVGPEGLSSGQEALGRVGAQLTKVVEQLSKEGGRSEETWKRLREATDKMNEYQQKLLELAQKPPSPEPRDIFSRLGSLATVVGILGGALTRSPLATSLEAGAAAMDAYNKNDLLTYQFQRENWKTQIGVIEKMATFQNQQIRNVLYDERMEQGEKMNRLHALLAALGHEEQAAQAQLGDERALRQWHRMSEQSAETLVERRRAEDERERHDRAMEAKGAGGTERLEVSKSFDIVDDKGKVVGHKMARERKDQAGFVDSETGEPLKLEPGQHLKQVTPTTSAGGRAGAQVLRQEIGAREVLSDLQNVSLLPVGTTTGPFGTYHPGTSIVNALQGDLVRQLTDQDSQLMQKSMANMTRELSVLMSPVYGGNWAAQQIDPLIPKAGETLGTVLFSIARLAQTADNALEAVSKSPILSNDQQEYALEMRKDIQRAIPWTPKEALEFAQRGQNRKETFGEFVKQNVGEKLPEGVPEGSKKVGTKDGNPVYKDPDGGLHMVH
jgi:hypothetical protein